MDPNNGKFHFEAYEPTAEDWTDYIERLEAYFEVNDFEEKKKVPAFISMVGAPTYKVLKDLVSPRKPSELEFHEIVHILQEYFKKNPVKVSIHSRTPSPSRQTFQTRENYPHRISNNEFALTRQPAALRSYPPSGALRPDSEVAWMPPPTSNTNCPLGLEYLTMIDQIIVQQKIEIMELITGMEMENEYCVKNSMGQMIYNAKEESTFCQRNCLGNLRPFDMKVFDISGREVIHIWRPYRCACCCCFCCLQKLEVRSPGGSLFGTVIQEWSLFKPTFRVEDESGQIAFTIEGPCCVGCTCSDTHFKVLTPDRTKVGNITKQWSGWVREVATDADNFSISFPLNLDVKLKATLFGALMMIDYIYFESVQNNRR